MIGDFFSFLVGAVFDFLDGFFGILPQSPFTTEQISQWLGVSQVAEVLSWVNYFLPLDIASSILALWSVGMMAYVGIKLAMKYTGEIV